MSCAEKMKWKVEKWGDDISTHKSGRRVSLLCLVIILYMLYGHMYRQWWFTALHSEVEKHAKIEVCELWETHWIHCPAQLYSIMNIYNSTIYDINNKFGNNSYYYWVTCKTNVAKKYEISPFFERNVYFVAMFDMYQSFVFIYVIEETLLSVIICVI